MSSTEQAFLRPQTEFLHKCPVNGRIQAISSTSQEKIPPSISGTKVSESLSYPYSPARIVGQIMSAEASLFQACPLGRIGPFMKCLKHMAPRHGSLSPPPVLSRCQNRPFFPRGSRPIQLPVLVLKYRCCHPGAHLRRKSNESDFPSHSLPARPISNTIFFTIRKVLPFFFLSDSPVQFSALPIQTYLPCHQQFFPCIRKSGFPAAAVQAPFSASFHASNLNDK